jgi:hypothetical protein
MMFQRTLTLALTLSCLLLGTAPVRSEEAHIAEVKKYVAEQVVPWIKDKIVLDTVKSQNASHAKLSPEEVKKLDTQWRSEIDKAEKPLINSVLNNALSKFLAEKKDASKGLITEIFVMDNKGLNVGQSDITSDYWQGDEAKWQKTFLAGKDAVFVDEVEKDESTQRLQSQISIPIVDADGTVIGAATFGIDVTLLLS